MKWGGLFTFAMMPGGERAYRFLTREVMGTQGSHIVKLRRVWPEIVKEFTELAGGALEGRKIWVHESGWTPLQALLNFLTCGNGGAMVNTTISGAKILERHITDAINTAIELADKLKHSVPISDERIKKVDSLRWRQSLNEIFNETGTLVIDGASPGNLPIPDNSFDLMYSGGQLEHYRPEYLEAWMKEGYRVMKPGGHMIAILDHRDHMRHFDGKLPFLYHYTLSDPIYRATHFSQLLYHNRLLPGEVAGMFESAGFEKVKIMRRVLPTNKWIEDGKPLDGELFGAKRGRLAPRFQNISDDDLKTAAAQYVYHKPV